LAFFGLAMITQVIGYLSVGYALGHLRASLVAPTMVGQPVVTALLAIPLLGEHLAPVQWIGGAVVLTGIYLVHRAS
jgi:drug/metabolite transporter (DMT)-like permease